jgi:hypothetical protein
MMKRLNLAYEVLGDPVRRAAYDRTRTARQRSTSGNASGPYAQADHPRAEGTNRYTHSGRARSSRPGPPPSHSRLPALAFWVIVAVAIPVLSVVASRLSSSAIPPESLSADIPTATPRTTIAPIPVPTPNTSPPPTLIRFPTSTPRPTPTYTPFPTPTPVPFPSGAPIRYEHLGFSYNPWEEVDSSTGCYQAPCFRSGDTRSVMQTIFFNRTDPRYRAGQPEGEINSFYLRLPSGQLEFKMEGKTVATWSGKFDWIWVVCELRPGTNYYIEWDYTGYGAAWVDNIQLHEGTKQPIPSCGYQQLGR